VHLRPLLYLCLLPKSIYLLPFLFPYRVFFFIPCLLTFEVFFADYSFSGCLSVTKAMQAF